MVFKVSFCLSGEVYLSDFFINQGASVASSSPRNWSNCMKFEFESLPCPQRGKPRCALMLGKFFGSHFPVGKSVGYKWCIRFRRPPQLLDIGLGVDMTNDNVVAFVVMQPRPFVEPWRLKWTTHDHRLPKHSHWKWKVFRLMWLIRERDRRAAIVSHYFLFMFFHVWWL